MVKYGKAVFLRGGEYGAKLQKTLITRLNDLGVIVVSKEDIEKWYNEDKQMPGRCCHTYMLHDKSEEDAFRAVMESGEMHDDSIQWKVTRFNHDPEFRKWRTKMEKKQKEKDA